MDLCCIPIFFSFFFFFANRVLQFTSIMLLLFYEGLNVMYLYKNTYIRMHIQNARCRPLQSPQFLVTSSCYSIHNSSFNNVKKIKHLINSRAKIAEWLSRDRICVRSLGDLIPVFVCLSDQIKSTGWRVTLR